MPHCHRAAKPATADRCTSRRQPKHVHVPARLSAREGVEQIGAIAVLVEHTPHVDESPMGLALLRRRFYVHSAIAISETMLATRGQA